jgi:hypothetical protein
MENGVHLTLTFDFNVLSRNFQEDQLASTQLILKNVTYKSISCEWPADLGEFTQATNGNVTA